MNKAKIAVLEKCFSSEVSSALCQTSLPLAQLRDSKVVRELVEEGMIQPVVAELGDRLSMKIKGYVLTDRGHLCYCEWAAQQPDAEPEQREDVTR